MCSLIPQMTSSRALTDAQYGDNVQVCWWGWKRKDATEPAIIHGHNVVAGWVSTFTKIENENKPENETKGTWTM